MSEQEIDVLPDKGWIRIEYLANYCKVGLPTMIKAVQKQGTPVYKPSTYKTSWMVRLEDLVPKKLGQIEG